MSVEFTHIHSSGRFDAPIPELEAAVDYYHTVSDICTYTEQDLDTPGRLAAFGGAGWDYFRAKGDRGLDECVIEWKTSMFTVVGSPEAVKLTNRQYYRESGALAAPVHVTTVILSPVADPGEKFAVMCAHMPLDNTPLRAEIWFSCCVGWVEYVKNLRANHPGIRVLLAADWNKNWRQAEEKARIQTNVAGPLGLRQCWDGHAPSTGGTHGPSGLIDGDLTDLIIRDARLVRDDASSDHRPYSTRLMVGQGSVVPSYEEQAQAEVLRLINVLERPSDDDDLLKICNFNVKRGHAGSEVISDIGYVFDQTNADMIGLQEAWPYIDAIVAGCSADWYVIHPSGADSEETTRISAVTILVRKDRFTMVSSRAFKGSEACPADDDVPSRWVIEVVADHLASGQRVKYLNTHMNSFVQPYGSNTSICRVREYQQHMNRILEVVENTDEEMPIFVSADWNVTFTNAHKIDFYPMRAFGRYGMVSNWSYDRDNNPHSTLKDGASLFDQIYHRKMAAVSFKGDMLVKNHHSDHFGVMAAYGLLHV